MVLITWFLCRNPEIPFSACAPLERTHASVLNAMKAAVHENTVIDGIKGTSPLVTLQALDLVWGLPPDYMHCVLEGVIKQLTDMWLVNVDAPYYIGKRTKEIDEHLCKIKPPLSFSRLPRSITERSFWKASEWKFWLLFYSVPCLDGVLPRTYLRHLSDLSQSVFLLLQPIVTEGDIKHSQRLLSVFAEQMPSLYGQASETFNVHQLLHIPKSVRMLGPLWATSTFPFESNNKNILNLVTAAKAVPMQIAERCVMHQMLDVLKHTVPMSDTLLGHLGAVKPGVTTAATCVLGAAQLVTHIEDNVKALLIHKLECVPTLEYLRCRINNVTIHSSKYERATKTASMYVKM